MNPDLLGRPVEAGTVIGCLAEDVAREAGLPRLPWWLWPVMTQRRPWPLCPAENDRFAYLSSGTWSLMGIESPRPLINDVTAHYNITNEGGVDGTVRVLRNITGMWVLEQCLRAWKDQGCDYSYEDVVRMASEARPFGCFVDTDDRELCVPTICPRRSTAIAPAPVSGLRRVTGSISVPCSRAWL